MAKTKSGGLTFEDFESSFSARDFHPIYFFFGEEGLLIEEVIALLIEHALDEAGKSFNLDIVYGGNTAGTDIFSRASSFSVIGERRNVVVKEFRKVVDKEPLLFFLAKPTPNSTPL